MVVLGHGIPGRSNPLYLLIFSFHMPLFIIISGYFFHSSVKKNTWQIIKQRFATSVLPIFLTSFLLFFDEYSAGQSLSSYLQIFYGIFIRNLWFLWAYFIDSMIILGIYKLVRLEPWRLIIVLFISLSFIFIPDFAQQAGAKFLFPCFAFGYYMKEFSLDQKYKQHRGVILFPAITLFVLMLAFFKYDYTFYTTGVFFKNDIFNPLQMIVIDVYRVCIGITGSVVFMCLVYEIRQIIHSAIIEKPLLLLGRYTLGVYISHVYINYYLLKIIPNHPHGNWLYTLTYTVLMVVVCYYLTSLFYYTKGRLMTKFGLSR